MSRFSQDQPSGGFRLASPVKVPVASEMPRSAPRMRMGPGRNHWTGVNDVFGPERKFDQLSVVRCSLL